MNPSILLPIPSNITHETGRFAPGPGHCIRISALDLFPAARVIQRSLGQTTTRELPIIAGGPAGGIALRLGSEVPHDQGYRLTIRPDGIEIVARAPAGAFYAAQTLAQLARQHPDALPALRIDDQPDFAARGVMLDISRDKVPTMATLYRLVDELAGMKINQLQLYTEHTFAYRAHPAVWAQASPMTGQEILELDRYCRERFIELVPNQNSFGHLERWLKLPQYIHLAEAPEGFDTPFDHRDHPFSLCPLDARSIEFLAGLYDELLPHFASVLFNVGCDETWDLGQGRSKAECEQRGRERVYLDFLLKIHDLVTRRGRRMQFWGDIILHQPELIGQLPRDAVALEWGYEADHPFDRDGALFARAGVPFYVCPGTSSWLSIAGRTDNALANLRNAAENGLKHGAVGYLNTDWGDWGHMQYLPVSYLGFAAGAAYGWSYRANRELDIAAAISMHLFRDRANVMGRVARELGNVYQAVRRKRANASVLFWRLVAPPSRQKEFEGVTRREYEEAKDRIDAAMQPIAQARMQRDDAELILDEYANASAMLRHACRRGRWALDANSDDRTALADDLRRIIGEHRRLWLARNRVGGLADSSRRLEDRLSDYA